VINEFWLWVLRNAPDTRFHLQKTFVLKNALIAFDYVITKRERYHWNQRPELEFFEYDATRNEFNTNPLLETHKNRMPLSFRNKIALTSIVHQHDY